MTGQPSAPMGYMGYGPRLPSRTIDHRRGLPRLPEGAPLDLDECGGHFGYVPARGQALYHYHSQQHYPYIMDCHGTVPEAARAATADEIAAQENPPAIVWLE